MTPSPTLVLVCDHRGEGLDRIQAPLEAAGHRVRSTSSLRETREVLAAVRPHALVVDPVLDDARAELIEVQRLRGEPSAPILLVVDPRDARPALESSLVLEGLLHDLVRRDAPAEEYVLRVSRLAEQAALERRVRELTFLATHDDRTGLLRPLTFEQRLAEHVSAAQRHHFALALAILDLDHFGQLNKRFDHVVGDEVIAAVGRCIRATLRTEDIGGRLGGDEFAVVLPYTGRVDAAHVVGRLLERIREVPRQLGDLVPGGPLELSASLGFETYDGSELESPDDLRKHAERALRRAKQLGGDRGLYYRSEVVRGRVEA